MAHAGRDVPVDRAEVVTLLIRAHFREFDALAAEHGAVFAREQRIDEAGRPELAPLDQLEDVPGDHGTPTASRIRVMTWSASMSSASASNVSRTRWRSTS